MTDTMHRQFSLPHTYDLAADEQVSEGVVSAVSAVADVDPTGAGSGPGRITPLYDVVDTDALDRVVRSSADDLTVAFPYLGYEVTVHGDGRVVVRDSDSATSPENRQPCQ